MTQTARMRRRITALAGLTGAMMASAAAAGPADAVPVSPFADRGAIRPAAAADAPRRFVLRDLDPADPAIPEGTVRTSVGRRLSPAGLSGSLGYLCGLPPSPNEDRGPVSSTERVGTFLGAQLRQSF